MGSGWWCVVRSRPLALLRKRTPSSVRGSARRGAPPPLTLSLGACPGASGPEEPRELPYPESGAQSGSRNNLREVQEEGISVWVGRLGAGLPARSGAPLGGAAAASSGWSSDAGSGRLGRGGRREPTAQGGLGAERRCPGARPGRPAATPPFGPPGPVTAQAPG